MLKRTLNIFFTSILLLPCLSNPVTSQGKPERQNTPSTGTGLVSQQIRYSGSFTNADKMSGILIIDITYKSNNEVSGYFNATNYSGQKTLCGAGSFTGFRQNQTVKFSFISNDPEPDCGFDRGWIFTVNATLSPNDTTLEGHIYLDRDANRRGVFRVIRAIDKR